MNIRNSYILFENMVINPFRDILVQSYKRILSFNGIALKLYFDSLQPLDASGDLTQTDKSQQIITAINSLSPLVANKVLETLTNDEIRGLVGLKKADVVPDNTNVNMSSQFNLDEFGEDISDEWVLIDERDVDYDNEDILNNHLEELEAKIGKEKKTFLSKLVSLVSTGTARPTAVSSQDQQVKGRMFKVRYKYTGNPNPERDFCKAMMSANKVYRKEDIDRMSESVVNAGFGEFGTDRYSIWKYKGGARCSHRWTRLTYMLNDKDVFEQIGTAQAAVKGYKVTNDWEVSIYPKNLPLKGFSPNNKNLPSDVK